MLTQTASSRHLDHCLAETRGKPHPWHKSSLPKHPLRRTPRDMCAYVSEPSSPERWMFHAALVHGIILDQHICIFLCTCSSHPLNLFHSWRVRLHLPMMPSPNHTRQ